MPAYKPYDKADFKRRLAVAISHVMAGTTPPEDHRLVVRLDEEKPIVSVMVKGKSAATTDMFVVKVSEKY